MGTYATLAAQIFPSKPAETDAGANQYVQSYGYYRFRLALPEFGRILGDRHAERDLREEVDHSDRLGPYERQVLAELLHAEPGLVLIVGSAGSGKSSTLRYVLGFYDRYQRPGQIRQGLGQFMRTLQITQFQHVFVDLNAVVDKMRHVSARETAEQAEDKLLSELPPAIQLALLKSLSPAARSQGCSEAALLMDIIDLVNDWVCQPNLCPPTFNDTQRARLMGIMPKLNHAQGLNNFSKFSAALIGLDGRTQLEFWFAILEAVTQMVQRPTGRGLVLIDNVDPLSQQLQSFLKGQLLDLVQHVSFKVVLPMRVSTFRQGETAYARSVTWYPHSGPSPIDVITTRILTFLAQPEEYRAYLSLSAPEQNRALMHTFELLLRLHRGGGEYRALGRVMAAAAGDSIRRAMQMMEHLVIETVVENDPRSDVADGGSEAITRLREVRRRYELRLLLERLGTALLEELTAISEETPLSAARDRNRWAAAVATRLASSVAAVLENAARQRSSKLSELEAGEVRNICTRELAGKMCREDVHTGWRLVATPGAFGPTESQLNTLREAVIARFKELVARPLDDALGGPDVPGTEVWELIQQGLRDEPANGSSHSDAPIDEDDVVSKTFDWDASSFCRNVLLRNGPHRAVRTLVKSAFVPDLFHDSTQDGAVSSGKMRILAVLGAQPRGLLTLAGILDYLASHSFNKPSVLRFINELISDSVRAIWINKSFAYRDYQELDRDRDYPCQLTRGGWGLLNVVSGGLNYLTSVFRPQAGMGNIGRLDYALNELSAIHQKDVRLHADWAKATDVPLPRNTSPDLLHGSAPSSAARAAEELIWHCRGHFRRVQRGGYADRLAQLVATREVVRRWHQFLLDSARTIAEWQPPESTGRRSSVPSVRVIRALDPSHRLVAVTLGLPAIKQGIHQLDSALRRNDLWCEGMEPDEFQPGDSHE